MTGLGELQQNATTYLAKHLHLTPGTHGSGTHPRRHLRQVLAASEEGDAGGGITDAEINRLLGGKAYKARLINKLIMLEDAVFMHCCS
jgi:hypothetical protein